MQYSYLYLPPLMLVPNLPVGDIHEMTQIVVIVALDFKVGIVAVNIIFSSHYCSSLSKCLLAEVKDLQSDKLNKFIFSYSMVVCILNWCESSPRHIAQPFSKLV